MTNLSKHEAAYWENFAQELLGKFSDLKEAESERCAEMLQTYLEKVCTRVGTPFAAPSVLCSDPTFGPYIISAAAILNDAMVNEGYK